MSASPDNIGMLKGELLFESRLLNKIPPVFRDIPLLICVWLACASHPEVHHAYLVTAWGKVGAGSVEL